MNLKASTYMQMAYLVSQESKCVSWKVGALIVKDGRVISTGYNGTVPGAPNCCDIADAKGWTQARYNHNPPHKNSLVLLSEHREAHSQWSKVNEIHAELNAIIFAARHGLSIEGATMYTTLCPCSDCAKAIAVSGIKQVVYCESYDRASPDWHNILTENNIVVQCLTKDRTVNNLNMDTIRTFGGENEQS